MNLDLEQTIHVGSKQTATFLVVGRAQLPQGTAVWEYKALLYGHSHIA